MSDVVHWLSKMFKKVRRAFIAVTIFVMMTVNCEISIYRMKDNRQVNIKFQDAASLFGGDIPMEGIKVILNSENTCKLKPISQFIIVSGLYCKCLSRRCLL